MAAWQSRKAILIGSSVIVLGSIVAGVIMATSVKKQPTEIVITFPGDWGSPLVAPLQHTMYGDGILGNEFEPLVDMERGGMIVPFAAKSWKMADDAKSVTFKIDTSRRFSDGSYLTAQDFKRSWEEGLKLDSKTAQKSLMDVMYKIQGFENFEKSGSLSGVEALDSETLKVSFSSPFRMVLDHLTGSRFAAFKSVGSRYIGTGPYVITDDDKDVVHLKKNEFAAKNGGADKVTVLRLSAAECAEAISTGKAHVFAYAGRSLYNGTCESQNTSCLDGFESAHLVALVNGYDESLFSDPELRAAVQYILTTDSDDVKVSSFFAKGALPGDAIDPQSFLPLQAGRLPETDAREIIENGEVDERWNPNVLNFFLTYFSGRTNITLDIVGRALADYIQMKFKH